MMRVWKLLLAASALTGTALPASARTAENIDLVLCLRLWTTRLDDQMSPADVVARGIMKMCERELSAVSMARLNDLGLFPTSGTVQDRRTRQDALEFDRQFNMPAAIISVLQSRVCERLRRQSRTTPEACAQYVAEN